MENKHVTAPWAESAGGAIGYYDALLRTAGGNYAKHLAILDAMKQSLEQYHTLLTEQERHSLLQSFGGLLGGLGGSFEAILEQRMGLVSPDYAQMTPQERVQNVIALNERIHRLGHLVTVLDEQFPLVAFAASEPAQPLRREEKILLGLSFFGQDALAALPAEERDQIQALLADPLQLDEEERRRLAYGLEFMLATAALGFPALPEHAPDHVRAVFARETERVQRMRHVRDMVLGRN